MPAPGEDVYARRLAVVLVVVLAADDEADAESALTHVAALVRDVLRASGGDAEPLEPDRVVAAFDGALDAVRAGFRVHERLAADVTSPVVRIAVGIDAADVTATGEDDALAGAIAAASRLATCATPGALAVSPTLARAVEEAWKTPMRDLGQTGDTHAVLLLPGAALGRRALPVRVIGGVGAAVVAGGVLASVLGRRARTVDALPVTLGVLRFKSTSDDVHHAWLREALRDGLNTQLSPLGGVKVYSREFLDFLITRQGLTEYEAATKLGLGKLLSGSVGMVEGVVRVEAQIVDITSGTVESSVVLVGHQDTLVALQNDLARAVIGRLGLQLTPVEARRLDQYRTTDLDAYRLLLEAEGTAAAVPPPPPSREVPRPGESGWLAPRAAWADEHERARVEIVAFLDRYRRAIEGGEADALAAFYVEFPPEQRAALARYLANVKDLRVRLDEVDVEVVGDEAIVSYTRTDDFVDGRTDRTMHVMTRPTKLLRRHQAEWRLAPGP